MSSEKKRTRVEVKPGQKWQDRDPRSPNVVEVLWVQEPWVRIQRPSKKVTVNRHRFVRTFRLVEDVPDDGR